MMKNSKYKFTLIFNVNITSETNRLINIIKILDRYKCQIGTTDEKETKLSRFCVLRVVS